MAGAAAAASGSPPVAASNKPAKSTVKSRYFARLATEAGVSTITVQTLFEHFGKQARDAMQNNGCFKLPNIASFSLNTCMARPGRTHNAKGRVFKSEPQPCSQRVRCSVAKALEQSAVASAPPSQNNKAASQTQTPAAKARSHKIANLIGAEDITSDVVGKVICALRKVIDRDLRTTGFSLLDGLAKLVLVDVEERSAEYVTHKGRTILLKAKGPHRKVYGRVQGRVGVWSPVCLRGCTLVVFSSVSFLPPQVLSVLQDDFAPNRRKGSVRRLFIRRDVELRQAGFTAACPGCEAAAEKAEAVQHSEDCRLRIEGELSRLGGGMKLELVREKLASGVNPHKRGRKHVEVTTALVMNKGVYIRGVDLRRFGYTDFCGGCDAAKHKRPSKKHNAACRRWIETKMLHDEATAARVERTRAKQQGSLLEAPCAKHQTTATSARCGTSGVAGSGRNARRVCILKADVRRFGHTDFCGGCDAAKQGVVKRHNDECRRRIEAKMLEGGATVARLKRAQKRLTEKTGKPVQAIAKAASAS
jgi:hypothetical protein